nr:hypothetical protein GCM10025699_71550 [Microbacterium flavescens]
MSTVNWADAVSLVDVQLHDWTPFCRSDASRGVKTKPSSWASSGARSSDVSDDSVASVAQSIGTYG